jgi:hypothetical protein
MKTYDKIKNLLEKLPHKIQVSFALYCAEDVYPLTNESKEAKLCIDLVKEWLENPDRPGLMEKLKDAANAAAYAAHAAASAAYTAFGAYDAVNVSDTAAYTAHSAACSTPYDEKLQEYYGVLLGYLTKVEKELYSLEEK